MKNKKITFIIISILLSFTFNYNDMDQSLIKHNRIKIINQ